MRPLNPSSGKPRKHGPNPLGEILKTVRRKSGIDRKNRFLRVRTAWEKIAGDDVLAVTSVKGHKSHVLEVEVTSSAHLYEIETYRKAELLKKLQDELAGKPHIIDIRFALSSFDD
ncbi:MAG: DUF721 domain-containing protein [Planctomycetes bacterium]|nr:DUF721 domain-containing protein [Planctomycetota bacterium]